MKKFILFLISLIVGLVFLIYLYQKVGIKEIIFEIKNLRYWQFFIIFLTSFLMISITIIRWKLIANDLLQIQLPFSSVIKARLGEMAISYFTPMLYFGGEWVRSYILNKEKNIPISSGLSTVLIDRVIEFIGAFLFLVLGTILLLIEKNFIWGFFLLILSLTIFIFLYLSIELIGFKNFISALVKIFHLNKIQYTSKVKGKTTVGERLIFLGEQLDLYFEKKHPKFYFFISLSCLTLLIWLFQTKLLLQFFGFSLELGKIFIIRIILILFSFIPIPADLGAFEGSHILAFSLFGLKAKTAVAFSLVTRGLDLIWVSLGVLSIFQFITELLFKSLKEKK
jgi:uncharacterized protein (TIRG00374 family)